MSEGVAEVGVNVKLDDFKVSSWCECVCGASQRLCASMQERNTSYSQRPSLLPMNG